VSVVVVAVVVVAAAAVVALESVLTPGKLNTSGLAILILPTDYVLCIST
jgi:hypothetical protein